MKNPKDPRWWKIFFSRRQLKRIKHLRYDVYDRSFDYDTEWFEADAEIHELKYFLP